MYNWELSTYLKQRSYKLTPTEYLYICDTCPQIRRVTYDANTDHFVVVTDDNQQYELQYVIRKETKMIKYIKMKFFYYQMKKSLFEMFMNAEDVISFITNLAVSCKDMTGDDLRKEVIHKISTLAHEQAVKEKEEENAKDK